jgi:hypothetical protein
MTEHEWLTSQDPVRMVTNLCYHWKVTRTKNGRRKLRLFGCACCRRVVHLFPDESWWSLVDLAEGLAEGTIGQAEVDTALEDAELELRDGEGDQVRQARGNLFEAVRKLCGPAAAAAIACSSVGIAIRWLGPGEAAECAQQVNLLRCIFGNPFRLPPVIQPAWLAWDGGTVVGLARTIYADRRFDDVPVLADALEEAGCRDEEVLGHLRGPGPHAKGCLVIDLLKGSGEDAR